MHCRKWKYIFIGVVCVCSQCLNHHVKVQWGSTLSDDYIPAEVPTEDTWHLSSKKFEEDKLNQIFPPCIGIGEHPHSLHGWKAQDRGLWWAPTSNLIWIHTHVQHFRCLLGVHLSSLWRSSSSSSSWSSARATIRVMPATMLSCSWEWADYQMQRLCRLLRRSFQTAWNSFIFTVLAAKRQCVFQCFICVTQLCLCTMYMYESVVDR